MYSLSLRRVKLLLSVVEHLKKKRELGTVMAVLGNLMNFFFPTSTNKFFRKVKILFSGEHESDSSRWY